MAKVLIAKIPSKQPAENCAGVGKLVARMLTLESLDLTADQTVRSVRRLGVHLPPRQHPKLQCVARQHQSGLSLKPGPVTRLYPARPPLTLRRVLQAEVGCGVWPQIGQMAQSALRCLLHCWAARWHRVSSLWRSFQPSLFP